ncbi:bifunctional 5,10-methylenetetrahydrofolate dehydrogenase/5,10-methenyltetrahydrofolate cyclohydrolase [Candidatus Lariskella endosymbiont of Hedychridium roseum]|uniref:bifunctional 5,10-methylenetetrahydrofolate dehydrogenase/5,10-methenyltetrahydrofolate cyclohydrolase n=1 Tax=Candidatus Lariskella endosymbiont of Hedychridium roseum TaxID=3077949 RepID=UPI0030CCD737
MKFTCSTVDGKAFAASILEKLKGNIAFIKERYNIVPGLAVVLVGNDPASAIYTNNKVKNARAIGIASYIHQFDSSISEEEVLNLLRKLNEDPFVHGILVQLPLPKHIDTHKIFNVINHLKDVDGFSTNNVGLLNSWQNCLEPCTPQGVLYLLKQKLGPDLSGKRAVVLGRSQIVGRPMSSMLIREGCTVTIMNSHSNNQKMECRIADILISAVGKPHMITREWVKVGAYVVDVGIQKVKDKLYGDVNFEDVQKVAGFLTPVPGGVGPMTIACLMKNTIKATCKQHNITLEANADI